ncbi:hypothetical protein MY11210_007875 [Beauveria gryllotalpidicola]
MDCSTLVCREGKCVLCQSDHDCTSGLCDHDTNKCKNCEKNSDCATRYCDGDMKRCKACVANADCDKGLICKEGKCVLCQSDHDCTSGLCDHDTNKCKNCEKNSDCATRYCDGDMKRCKACVANADCDEGLICKGGKCVLCQADSDCVLGLCDLNTKKCKMCENDTDCATGHCDSHTKKCGSCDESYNKSCKGKCIPLTEQCDKRCSKGYKVDGTHCVLDCKVDEWECNGKCVPKNLSCDGKCADPSKKLCKDKCITKNYPCPVICSNPNPGLRWEEYDFPSPESGGKLPKSPDHTTYAKSIFNATTVLADESPRFEGTVSGDMRAPPGVPDNNRPYTVWQYFGYFIPQSSGKYSFQMFSDDASYLWLEKLDFSIRGAIVISANDGYGSDPDGHPGGFQKGAFTVLPDMVHKAIPLRILHVNAQAFAPWNFQVFGPHGETVLQNGGSVGNGYFKYC